MFSKILETIILDFLESNNILGETQCAFRKDRRIEDQIFSLQGIKKIVPGLYNVLIVFWNGCNI
jgi:hypothetical protein